MSTPPRQQPSAVIDRLLAQPHRYAFFQAVRLLERWIARSEGLGTADVLDRRLAFGNSLSLSFPASEIAALRPELREDAPPAPPDARRASTDYARIALTPAFIGLLGGNGALPNSYTELLAEREQRTRDAAPRAFLDIFQHRTVALFYQAWQKHRLAVQFEADRRQRFLPLVLALAGMGHPGLQRRLQAAEGGVADDALAHFSGTLQRRPMSAVALQGLLQHYFGVPVHLEPFVGRWYALPQAHQSRLGLGQVQLGQDCVLGQRIWQRHLRVRLRFGPLSLERFQRFLPGGSAARALRELLQLATGTTLEYEVRLSLRATDVQGIRLGDSGPGGPRLGWNSFLVTRPQATDRHDAGYDLLATG